MLGRENQQGLLVQIIPYSEQHLKKKFFYFGRRGKVRILGLFLFSVNISSWMLLETALYARGTRLRITVLQLFLCSFKSRDTV